MPWAKAFAVEFYRIPGLPGRSGAGMSPAPDLGQSFLSRGAECRRGGKRHHPGLPLRTASNGALFLPVQPRVQPRPRLPVVILHHLAEPDAGPARLHVLLIQMIEAGAAQDGGDVLDPVQRPALVDVGAGEE